VALVAAIDSPATDPRLEYFRAIVQAAAPSADRREDMLTREYLRAMRFLYEKEFVAQQAGADAVAALYRTRGLSTDTAVEAGYLVYLGLGVLKALEPVRQVRRVLIIGPGLDVAPRTGLIDVGPPESYQPWAVIDALVALRLSRVDELQIVAADINPRVVDHLRRSRAAPPVLTLTSGIRESDSVMFSREYRDYFDGLGRAIGKVDATAARAIDGGRLQKVVGVSGAAARTVDSELLDVAIERDAGTPFDVVIATNILPYFDEVELMLALSNIARMLGPDGVLLHNESRVSMRDTTETLGMPLEQSRQAIIAAVRDAPGPLVDRVYLHRKKVQ
jgi:SAM-dependent methyltransferase